MARLIIIGASARAAAASARRAGYEPWCIDLFADRDLRAIADVIACPPDRYPQAIPELLDRAPSSDVAGVLFAGAMENHIAVVEAVADRFEPIGPTPAAMASARNPLALAELPQMEGIHVCAARLKPTLMQRLSGKLLPRLGAGGYLLKPIRSSAGVGVRDWDGQSPVDDKHYLQQFVPGAPISVVYKSDGWSCLLLGGTEQLIGDEELGVDGFRFAGNLGPLFLSEPQRAALMRLGVALTQQHDLRGLFGVDLILDARGRLWPIEVNPRYTASVELVEKLHGVAALTPMHGEARGAGALPPGGPFHAKGIVHARKQAAAPDVYELFDRGEVADVPDADQPIARGKPVCTLFADGPDRETCLQRLHEKAARVYAAMGT